MKNHWKLTIAGLLLMVSSVSYAAPMLDKGTRELTLQGIADLESRDDYYVHLEGGYGYFFWDKVELGLNLAFTGTDAVKRINLGPFVEYSHRTGTNWVPYINFATKWVNADVDFGRGERLVNTSSDALLLAGEAGMKYFVADNIAVSTGFAYEWATSDIFDAKDDVEDGNSLIKIGMRFYF